MEVEREPGSEARTESGSLAEIAKDAEEGWGQNLCGEVRE